MNNFYRKKLLNTIIYFAKNFRHANMTKVFKLLNWFDFEHFCETGHPAIGLQYYTFQMGPVPKDLWLELKDGNVPEDFKKHIIIDKINFSETDPEKIEYLFKAKHNVKVDLSLFSQRERDILDRLKLQFKTCTATMMSKISHEKDRPWTLTKDKYGLNKIIDYKLALQENSCISENEANENLKEHFEMLENFNLNPT